MSARASVPFPANEPVSEIDEVIAKLRAIRVALMADSQMMIEFTSTDAEMLVGNVLDQLDPIRTFLAENTLVGDCISFLECRRQWFVQKGGAE